MRLFASCSSWACDLTCVILTHHEQNKLSHAFLVRWMLGGSCAHTCADESMQCIPELRPRFTTHKGQNVGHNDTWQGGGQMVLPHGEGSTNAMLQGVTWLMQQQASSLGQQFQDTLGSMQATNAQTLLNVQSQNSNQTRELVTAMGDQHRQTVTLLSEMLTRMSLGTGPAPAPGPANLTAALAPHAPAHPPPGTAAGLRIVLPCVQPPPGTWGWTADERDTWQNWRSPAATSATDVGDQPQATCPQYPPSGAQASANACAAAAAANGSRSTVAPWHQGQLPRTAQLPNMQPRAAPSWGGNTGNSGPVLQPAAKPVGQPQQPVLPPGMAPRTPAPLPGMPRTTMPPPPPPPTTDGGTDGAQDQLLGLRFYTIFHKGKTEPGGL
jgi:hypothetical protein